MDVDITKIAALLGDASRAKIVLALMGGQALTAGELSAEAEIMPQTASGHLKKLSQHGLVLEHRQGRHRYFRLRDRDIASMIESLLNVSSSDLGAARYSDRATRSCVALASATTIWPVALPFRSMMHCSGVAF